MALPSSFPLRFDSINRQAAKSTAAAETVNIGDDVKNAPMRHRTAEAIVVHVNVLLEAQLVFTINLRLLRPPHPGAIKIV